MPSVPFKTIESEIVYGTSWFRVQKHEVEVRGDGHRFTYSYLSTAPSVMVVAVTPRNQIVLVRQFRYPSREFSFELPGGGTGGQDALEAASDELREETGFRAGRVRKLGDFVVYCGLSDESCSVVLAEDLEPGEQALEKTEHITVHPVGYPELDRMIREGEFRDGMGLAALRIAEPFLQRLASNDCD